MFVHLFFSLGAVLALLGVAWVGTALMGMHYLFGVVIPYLALVIFVVGLIYRMLDWAKSPVPFRIPTTCGQEKSLPWVKTNAIDNPCSTPAVIVRMFFEVFLFRSLFRNNRIDYRADGPALSYTSSKWLWFHSLLFHYAFLVVLIWHLRFFMEPVPGLVKGIEALDGFLEVGLPQLLISGVLLLAMAGFLLQRRVQIPQVRYISMMSDYFPLLLIIAIAITGILMRYFLRVDVDSIKQLTMGLATFHPVIPADPISPLFYMHLFLVSFLFAYFPFSKLMHLGGIWLSPTRNLVNNSRVKRHVNPWNYPVKTHTYQEYEEEFHELMEEAGLPLDKDYSEAPAEEEAQTEGAEAEKKDE